MPIKCSYKKEKSAAIANGKFQREGVRDEKRAYNEIDIKKKWYYL